MISSLLDFFPFNMDSGPAFLGFYLVLLLFTMFGLWGARQLYGAYLDFGQSRSQGAAHRHGCAAPRTAAARDSAPARSPGG